MEKTIYFFAAFVQNAGFYNYANTGKGIILLLKSQEVKGHLKFGRLYVNTDDEAAKLWANEIFKWTKRNGKKVYRATNPLSIVSDLPEKNFYCYLKPAKYLMEKTVIF